jgi:hypothetical protein
MTIRRSGLGRRETFGPPEIPHGALVSLGCPRRESGMSDPGTREVRVHAVRLGGRSRLDASRVFMSERSRKGLLVIEGASQEEVRSPPDAGRGWAEGETVRVREVANQFPHVRPAGLGLQALDTTEGVLGLMPASLSPVRRRRALDSEVNSTSANGPQGRVSMLDSTSGGQGFRLGCASE